MIPFRGSTDSGRFAGAILLGFAFGSLHAFAVLLEPLEREWGAGRTVASLGYSVAIVALTLGVFASRNIGDQLGPGRLAVAVGVVGGTGVTVAALGSGVISFLLGYGVLFGFSNGLAYSLFLGQAAAAVPRARGFAIGLVTASYGLGAAVFTQCLGAIANSHSVRAALWVMALTVLLAGLLSAIPFSSSGIPGSRPESVHVRAEAANGSLLQLWFVYFLGACGGLMVIAHAAAIMSDIGVSAEVGWYAATFNAVGNVCGSAIGGTWADRVGSRRALAAPLLMSAAAMSMLGVTGSYWMALALILLCGMSYGALISIVPVIVRKTQGAERFNRSFGIVFTSWGAAGLVGPSIAAALHDHFGDYDLAIAVAISFSVVALGLNAVPGTSRHSR